LGNGTYQGWLMTAPDGSVVAGAGLWLMEWPPGVRDLSKYRGYVFNVYTERAHRKKGFSHSLMQALLDACAAQGVHVVCLHASPEGKHGYEALGFTPTDEMRILLPQK
jgi:GNAT superfamily N-acetyltransferase